MSAPAPDHMDGAPGFGRFGSTIRSGLVTLAL